MNYPTAIPFLFILLGLTFLTTFLPIVSADGDDPSIDCATEYLATKPIDTFELKTVGVFTPEENQVDPPAPVRTFVTGDGLTVHLFYEGAPDSVTEETLIDVTLYTVGDGPATPVQDACYYFNAGYANNEMADGDDNGSYTFSEANGICCSSRGSCGAECGDCGPGDYNYVPCVVDGVNNYLGFKNGGGSQDSPPLKACAVPVEDPAPCGLNGELLSSDLYSVGLTAYDDDNYNRFFTPTAADQCYPQTINGVVAQAEIIMMEDPFDQSGETTLSLLIYDPTADGLEDEQDGRLQFCARIAYYTGRNKDELISYIDSKVVLDVSLSAEILFTQEISISSTGDTREQPVNTVTKDVSTTIDVESFLCGDPDVNDGKPYADEYSLGQSFRVCVDVTASDEDKFALTNFGEVKCSTESGSDTIIISVVDDVATAVSPILTTLFDNGDTLGAASFDDQNTASSSAISFSTVLTNAYFTGDDETLTCAGSVDVETVSAPPDLDDSRRRQLVSFTVPNLVSSSLRRRMDEETGTALAGAATAAEFGAIIKLSLSSSSLAAPGPFPVWATILIVIVCSVPCCLVFLVVWLKKRRTEKEEPEEKEETEDEEETE